MPSAVIGPIAADRRPSRVGSPPQAARCAAPSPPWPLVGLLVSALMPTVRKAVNELSLPLAYSDVIRQQAAQKHLDPALIAAVIYAETKFNPRASSAGAEGAMQIMPKTALYLAHRSGATSFTLSDLNTPQVNIAYGSYYLRYLLDQFHGDKVLALAAYNGGVANVEHWQARARAAWAALRLTGSRSPRRATTSRRCSPPSRTTGSATPSAGLQVDK